MTLDEVDRYCRALPGCEVRYPFDSNPQVRSWCAHRKIFAWAITDQQTTMIQLKDDPDLVPTLIGTYAWIHPGYHMNKRPCITVNANTSDRAMLLGLLEDAHNLVLSSLPKSVRLHLLGDVDPTG